MFAIQAVIYFLFSSLITLWRFDRQDCCRTFDGMLAIFPVVTAYFYGVKNLGANCGVMITARGVGCVVGPLLGVVARDVIGQFEINYIASAVLSVAGALLSLMVKHPEAEKQQSKIRRSFMLRRRETLEKIRKTLAVLSDDVQWKLEDIVLSVGDLIDEEKKVSVDTLRKLGSMNSNRIRLLLLYLEASEERNALLKQRVEELWDVEDEELEGVLEDLEGLFRDDGDREDEPQGEA